MTAVVKLHLAFKLSEGVKFYCGVKTLSRLLVCFAKSRQLIHRDSTS